MTRLLLMLVAFMLVLTTHAQDDPLFTLQTEPDTPAIAHLAATRDTRDYEYNERFTDPGAVVFHDGQYHMFRNGFNGWPARVWVHYHVSDDGINWEQVQDAPVLLSSDVEYAELAALASSVHVDEDGTWVLYFYTWNSTTNANANQQIGRATADNPLGPWSVDPAPVLEKGAADSWNSAGVMSPTVVRQQDGEGYLMYYDGLDDAGVRRIGVATSDDGINWQPSDDNPILDVTEDYEGDIVNQPRVVNTDDGYLMIYRTIERGDVSSIALAAATSDDGITWEKSEQNPLVTPDDYDMRAIWYTSLLLNDDTLYLYLELMPDTSVTDIYVATAPLSDL